MLNRPITLDEMDVRDILGRVAGCEEELWLWVTTTDLESAARCEVVETFEMIRQTLEQARINSTWKALKHKEVCL